MFFLNVLHNLQFFFIILPPISHSLKFVRWRAHWIAFASPNHAMTKTVHAEPCEALDAITRRAS